MKLPSFEDPLDGVTPPGWTRNEAPLDSYPEARVLDEFASDGDFSLKMDGKRFSTPLTNTASSGRVGEWETVTHVETAPEGAVGVTVWFYANTNYEGVTYWDNAKLHASRHAD